MSNSFYVAGRECSSSLFVRFVIVFLALVAPAAAANISGTWYGSFTAVSGDSGSINVVFSQTGSVLTGFLTVPGSSCIGTGGQISGTVTGNTINFGNIAIAGGVGPNAITFSGTVDSANELHGFFRVNSPCTPDSGSWILSTVPTTAAQTCPDCVHAVGGTITVNTLPMWGAISPATLVDSLLTQDSAGVFHVGSYLSFGGTSGGVSSAGPNSGLTGHDTGPVGPNIGVFGEADGDNGAGVLGYAPACTSASPCTASAASPNAGFTAGVRGVADGTNGYGVRGFNGSTTGTTHGIEGRVTSPDGRGAEGFNTSTSPTGAPVGVFGRTVGAKGTAVWGNATTSAALGDNSTTGVLGSGKTGVSGFANVGDQGVGVWGANFSNSGWTRGVLAQIFSPAGEALAVEAPNGGNLLVGRSGPTYTQVFHVENNGNFHSAGAFLPGGADFAESMRVEGASAEYAPGDVLIIDRGSTRQLTVSAEPYSHLVAGIYSTKPGVLASPGGSSKVDVAKEVPLAVVGIVPCKVSAENGPIAIGDLLVTSSKAGHAMKGTDRTRMLGAIVGKALEPLGQGTGVIQVLVTLQ